MSIARVSDSASNGPEQIDHAARAIGRSVNRRKVFEVIYHGKVAAKTVSVIASKTGLSNKQVLTEGKKLANNNVVEQTTLHGETAYEKINYIHQHKKKILSLAGNEAKLAKLPTKRNPQGLASAGVITVRLSDKRAKTTQITIDDVDNFAKARKLPPGDWLPASVSEKSFKELVKRALGVRSNAKDWGGEKNDLHTTQLKLNKKRQTAVFAFKGPGLRSKLVPGKMGKNGDQMQRLFEAAADVFFVQHWTEIDQSVLDGMASFAVTKSSMTGKPVWYGIIDGQDSNRLWLAYGGGAKRRPTKRKSTK